MLTGITIRRGICMELLHQFNGKAGFFFGFSDGSGFKRFAVIHESTWQCPPMRRIFPFHEHNTVSCFDDNIYG